MALLPHDVIERILERIDVKTLLKFQVVSKLWRSTIQDSPSFQQRQLIQQHRQSRGDHPDLLFVSLYDPNAILLGQDFAAMRTLTLGSVPSVSVQIPTLWEDKFYEVCKTSCDGLVYLFDDSILPSIVVNPTTRWHRIVPLCNYQLADKAQRVQMFDIPYSSPGFGKDKIKGIYKSVWLYNNKMSLNDNLTTCEVFDFVTNSWRYVVPASPYRILHRQEPVYVDGSLHWFTDFSPQGETMVLSFDLHTETFQIISKAPFIETSVEKINICNLDDHLCVSQENEVNQVIWSFDSVHKIWNLIYFIDLNVIFFLAREHTLALQPLGILGKDKRLLFYVRGTSNSLVILDPKTNDYYFVYASRFSAYTLCYFPSLVSFL